MDIKTFGAAVAAEPGNPPPGFYVPVVFDQLLLLDERTRDGRLIGSENFEPFDLPRSIKAQFKATVGHDNADIVGRLDEVTVNADGVPSGSGWLLDDEFGRRAAFLIKTKAFRGNSVDLSVKEKDISVSVTEDADGFLSFEVDYHNARLAATTLVAEPAFENAGARIPDGWEVAGAEELTAPVLASATEPEPAFCFNVISERPKMPSERFANPNFTELTPLFVDTDDHVFGHLASWEHEHQNLRIIAPHSKTNYAYYANRSVETVDGFVATGPLVIDGNHADVSLGYSEAVDHYANTCAAWGDVCVGEDEFGIWFSGSVRPGTKAETVYAGRASGISGDWRWIGAGHELIASLSVNTPAFPTPKSFGHSESHPLTILSAGFVKPRQMHGNLHAMPASAEADLAFVAKTFARQRIEELANKHGLA